jgi:hypothetical protein
MRRAIPLLWALHGLLYSDLTFTCKCDTHCYVRCFVRVVALLNMQVFRDVMFGQQFPTFIFLLFVGPAGTPRFTLQSSRLFVLYALF